MCQHHQSTSKVLLQGLVRDKTNLVMSRGRRHFLRCNSTAPNNSTALPVRALRLAGSWEYALCNFIAGVRELAIVSFAACMHAFASLLAVLFVVYDVQPSTSGAVTWHLGRGRNVYNLLRKAHRVLGTNSKHALTCGTHRFEQLLRNELLLVANFPQAGETLIGVSIGSQCFTLLLRSGMAPMNERTTQYQENSVMCIQCCTSSQQAGSQQVKAAVVYGYLAYNVCVASTDEHFVKSTYFRRLLKPAIVSSEFGPIVHIS